MFDNFQVVGDVNSEDIKIAGYDFNCDDPKVVMIIVHGIGEYAGRYKRIADTLSKRGIKVYSFDLKGHGISGGVRGDAAPRQDVLSHIDALTDMVRKKHPGLPLVLYGHSMGGNIALDYKGRGDRNGLFDAFIISAPWIRLVRPVPKALYKVIKLGSKLRPTLQINSKCDEKDLGNLIYVKPYNSDPLVHGAITIRCALDGFDIGTALERGEWKDNGLTSGKPTLLMQGSADKICDPEGARALAKLHDKEENFKYVEWEGYFHEIHNGNETETGDDVIEAIGDFVIAEVLRDERK